MKRKPKIIYAGNYSKGKGYPRANVLLEGLKKNCDLKEIYYPLWKENEDKEKNVKKPYKKIIPFLKSIFFFLKNAEELKSADAVIVGFPGYFEIFVFKFIKLITGADFPIFFDYFFSLYESLVFERKVVKENSFLAKFLYFFDKAGLLTADKVLIDTENHRDFIAEMFGIEKEKFVVIPVGESEEYFSFLPYPKEKNPFTLVFFGTFLNLHGIDKIKEAVKLLENEEIRFILIGRGKNDTLFKSEKFKNLEFINDFLPPEKLKKYIEKSHVVLGIFGENKRAGIVIPCKIYDALACGRPVITGKTPASRTMFENLEFVILCKNSPEKIAKSIKKLSSIPQKNLEELGKKAYKYYKENFSPESVTLKLLKEIKNDKQRKR